MIITIDDSMKILNIQEDFNIVFPYLKIEFFTNPYNKEAESSKKFEKNNHYRLGKFRTIQNNKELTITSNMTVVQLEQCFMEVYGLGLQVFRKSGKGWLGTTVTNGWTLEEQNKQGEALSNYKK